MRAPIVSIVMPTWHQHEHIGDALQGLANQRYQDFELIVVQDGPDSRTDLVLERRCPFGLGRLLRMQLDKNEGTAVALNEGFKRARGKYWTWVSSDNVMDPEWLSLLVPKLLRKDGADIVYSSYYRQRGAIVEGRGWAGERKGSWVGGRKDRVSNPKVTLIDSLNCFIGPSFLYKRELHGKVGEHRGLISHDYDWWLRAEEVARKWTWIDQPLATYRVHDQRVTVTRSDQFDAERWRAEAIERRGL